MDMKQCRNGHLYNSSLNSVCPYCGAGEMETPSVEEICTEVEALFPGYRVISRIGSGRTGTVYRVEGADKRALKVIDCGADSEKLLAAKREFEYMQKAMACPNVLSAFRMEMTESGGNTKIYILEELATPLLQYYKQSDITVSTLKNILSEVCTALKYLKAMGIRHLDLKPDNLYVSYDGKIKLGDFSHAIYVSELDSLKRVLGTEGFIAPEIHEKFDYNNTTEIYSLGIIMHYLLCGKMPFDVLRRDNKVRKPEDAYMDCGLSEAYSRIIQKATAYLPEDRYKDTDDFLYDILSIPESLMTDKPVVLATSKPPEKQSSRCGWEDVDEFAYTCPVFVPAVSQNAETDASARKQSLYVDTEDFGDGLLSYDESKAQLPRVNNSNAAISSGEGAVKSGVQKVRDVLGKLFGAKKKGTSANTCDSVQFRGAAPAVFKKDEYTQLKILMYREDDFSRADREVKKLGDKTVENSSGVFDVAKGEKIRIVLQSPDIAIEEDMQEIVWNGIFSECTFDIYVPGDYEKKQIRFKGRLYSGQAVLTDIRLIVSVEASGPQQLEVEKCSLASAFVSYASRDRSKVVARIQGIQAARRDMDIFLDVEKLRCGEKWEERLYREIEERSIFYLFWSLNAYNSEWVKKELEHAIRSKGVDCVEPIPLEPPEICPPPEELKERHFNDWTLRYLMGENKPDKDEIRKTNKSKRNRMSREEVNEQSTLAAEMFLSSEVYRSAGCIMLYMPLDNETDTGLILRKALDDGKKVVLPITDTVNTDIIPCLVDKNTVFKPGAYSIAEPENLVRIDESEIDVVVVPGIAFDKAGSRIGFGKGYYDRFLSRTGSVKVGFCYDFQLVDAIPSDAHDVPVNYVVSNNGIYKTNPKVN